MLVILVPRMVALFNGFGAMMRRLASPGTFMMCRPGFSMGVTQIPYCLTFPDHCQGFLKVHDAQS